jgi:hypothetical protein
MQEARLAIGAGPSRRREERETYPAEPKTLWPISMRVNKPDKDDPSILDRIAELDRYMGTPTGIGSPARRSSTTASLISNRERSRVGNTDRARSKGMLDMQARSMQAEGRCSHMQEGNRNMALHTRVGNNVVSSRPPRWTQR